jgi:hypothetical protein
MRVGTAAFPSGMRRDSRNLSGLEIRVSLRMAERYAGGIASKSSTVVQ